jgi:hypothetical protein
VSTTNRTGWAVGAILMLASARAAAQSSCGIEGGAADPPTFANCTGCHSDHAPNSGDGSLRLAGVPLAWTPGTVYRVSGILADPGQRLWGFHVTAIDGAGQLAGTLAPADANTTPCLHDGRLYLAQTGTGRRPNVLDGPVAFDFDWTAPSAGAGQVVFYAQGIACNFDGAEGGDFTYTAAAASLEAAAIGSSVSLVLQPDATSVARGSDLVVRARIENHGAASRRVFVASRLRLPSGRTYPRSGFLESPAPVDLAAGEQATRTFTLHVPAGAPQLQVRWETLVGVAPATLLAQDSFGFSVN